MQIRERPEHAAGATGAVTWSLPSGRRELKTGGHKVRTERTLESSGTHPNSQSDARRSMASVVAAAVRFP